MVVILVTTVFLVQNQFYADVLRRSEVQEEVRSVTELIRSEISSIPAGGVLRAQEDQFAFRTAVAIGGICAVSGNETYVHIPLNGEALDTTEITGYGIRDSSGDWDYNAATWSSMFGAQGSSPASTCEAAGADTTGATDEFFRLDNLSSTYTIGPGVVVMLVREIELTFDTSELDSVSVALFRGPYGGTLVEFATGMASDARFEYRQVGDTTYSSPLTGGALLDIDAVRVYVNATSQAIRGGEDPYEYGWTVHIPLRNSQQ